MIKCPKKEILERFLDNKLTDDASQDILSHLSSCDICKTTIRNLLTEEKKLLRSLLLLPSSNKGKTLAQFHKCPSRAAILAYASECLNEEQTIIVESHLENCDHCLNELINIQKSLNSSTEIELDLIEAMAGILEMILKVTNGFLEIVKYSGELLSLTPQLSPVRGKERATKDTIIIRKDFKNTDFSVEITAPKRLDKFSATLKVSLMRLSSEEFISGMDLSLSSEDKVQQKEKTNKEGIVEFHGVGKGKYDVNMKEKKIACITIE
ncbi:MAG: hypothetical protein M1381_11985 [Deltaproteobacteria bacterium]|nr:hypothetical protein [Deltaproteobacteria bacterium]